MERNDLVARIDRLESHSEIRMLPAKYALALDMRDLDALANLFAPDIQVSRDKVGRAHFKTWMDETLRNQFTGTAHHIGGHIIEFRDADHACGVVYSKKTSTRPAPSGSSCRCSTGTTMSASMVAGTFGAAFHATGMQPT
ncbi:nuclear transport factor 2 family protein [Undibacterium arcticum]